MSEPSARLYLITPVISEAAAFRPRLEAALAAGDVACVLLRTPAHNERLRRTIAAEFAPVVQAHGTALLVEDDTRAAAGSGADGVHATTVTEDLDQMVRSMKPSRIVGCGGLGSRDDAMVAGESGADYVMFGDASDAGIPPLEERVERTGWWAEIFQVPCVACAYALDEIEPLARAGAEFVALGDAVWNDPRGAGAAVREAERRLESAEARPAGAEPL